MSRRAKAAINQPREEPERPIKDSEPDQAWKVLSLVNDWIRHAEAKAGATLAAAGVTGAVLYNMINSQTEASLALQLAAVACAAFVFLAGLSAGVALVPRLRLRWCKKEDSTNLLFFGHVACAYKSDGPTYGELLHALTSNRHCLTRHIAHQVHANANVAHRKYKWASLALLSLMVALGRVSWIMT